MTFRQRATAAGAAAFCILQFACHRTNVPVPTLSGVGGIDTTDLLARGRYIVRDVAVCGHCHGADPKRDVDGPLSGGMEFTDWRIGTARAANITSDSATGIGAWSDVEIIRAVRNGQDRSGRLLAPVMPYVWFSAMSDRDALAVARYLKTLPPVRNETPQRPNFWFKLGKLFFLGPKGREHADAPPPGATAAYGAYLANHVGLCADCHTPRVGISAAADKNQLFAGDATPPKGFPENPANLTPDSATGIGRWNEADFLRTLRTGVNPAGDSLHAFMPWREVRRMSDDDLRAIYVYLRSLRPIRSEIPKRAPPSA